MLVYDVQVLLLLLLWIPHHLNSHDLVIGLDIGLEDVVKALDPAHISPDLGGLSSRAVLLLF
jgi:hypothetical protein